MLVIFCIILLKNTNNLLIELGSLAVKAFLLDLKRDLLVSQKNSKLGEKCKKAILAIDSFCKKQSESSYDSDLQTNISNKVNKLKEILIESHS